MAHHVFLDELLEDGERSLRRRQRVFHDRLNPLEQFSELELHQRYRFNSHGIRYLTNMLNEDLEHPTKRSHAIPVVQQVCTALRFYACGSFLQVSGDCNGISKSAACTIVQRVSEALVKRMPEFIKFPLRNSEITRVKGQFQNIANMPGVTGCIDCTHIRIIAPSEFENDFVNRKGYHSINCQFVCLANGLFVNAVLKHPGCAHDSRIFQESNFGRRFERGELRGFLLGDSGYPCRRYLLTPILNAETDSERAYNAAHSKTRSRIEQTFGIFKRRFYGLHTELRVKPAKACLLIGACAVLHNIAILENQPNDFDGDDDNQEELFENNEAFVNEDIVADRADGQRVRRHFIASHFV